MNITVVVSTQCNTHTDLAIRVMKYIIIHGIEMKR